MRHHLVQESGSRGRSRKGVEKNRAVTQTEDEDPDRLLGPGFREDVKVTEFMVYLWLRQSERVPFTCQRTD